MEVAERYHPTPKNILEYFKMISFVTSNYGAVNDPIKNPGKICGRINRMIKTKLWKTRVDEMFESKIRHESKLSEIIHMCAKLDNLKEK